MSDTCNLKKTESKIYENHWILLGLSFEKLMLIYDNCPNKAISIQHLHCLFYHTNSLRIFTIIEIQDKEPLKKNGTLLINAAE